MKKMKRKSTVPRGVKRGIGKASKGKGSNQPMNFHTRDARKKRNPSSKGRNRGAHTAKDNIRGRR